MSEEIAAQFLARLLAIQGELRMTNAQFARELGVGQGGYISRLRAGQRGSKLTLAFALRAAERFPELRLFLLPPDVSKITDEGAIITPADAEEPSR